ncbi:hypothetical protein GCM10023074_61880 [Microbispora amethystogenes]|uniref:Uncharacterized protein n=1 Tax=Microbispora amethystogenes TaxID=1427754 RepID=A0ABQ4FJH1_9ACTN|nr:hypothetical protein Mam01_51060 [Microbispora amethystogenes]
MTALNNRGVATVIPAFITVQLKSKMIWRRYGLVYGRILLVVPGLICCLDTGESGPIPRIITGPGPPIIEDVPRFRGRPAPTAPSGR